MTRRERGPGASGVRPGLLVLVCAVVLVDTVFFTALTPLLGPVVGGVASHVGTGPAFAAATAAGVCLTVASLLTSSPLGGTRQGLRSALPAVCCPRCG